MQNLVVKKNLFERNFIFDEQTKKIKVNAKSVINITAPNQLDQYQYGLPTITIGENEQVQDLFSQNDIKSVVLEGSNLKFTRSSGAFTVSLANLIPAVKADIFLKSVEYNQDTQKLIFKTGNATNADDDNTIEVAVSDLIPVTTGNGLTGNGTVNNPIKIDKAQLKPIATVHLQDAFGDEIGYAFLSTERSAS